MKNSRPQQKKYSLNIIRIQGFLIIFKNFEKFKGVQNTTRLQGLVVLYWYFYSKVMNSCLELYSLTTKIKEITAVTLLIKFTSLEDKFTKK